MSDQDPAVISSLAKALITNAQDLGISWNLRPATVIGDAVGPLVNKTVNATFDGDSVPITMVNITGQPLVTGQRVYVLMIAQTGNYIFGFVDVPTVSIFGVVSSGGTLASSSGAEVAIPALSWAIEPVARVRPNWIARISINCASFVNTATDSVMIIRVRAGSASTAGTQLGGWRVAAPSASTTIQSNTLLGYAINTNSNANRTSATTLSLTIQTGNGAATMGLYADSTLPTVVTVEEICPVSTNPTLAAICASF